MTTYEDYVSQLEAIKRNGTDTLAICIGDVNPRFACVEVYPDKLCGSREEYEAFMDYVKEKLGGER